MGTVSLDQGERKWWKEAVVYQVYPASFLDTNGDGWGDVNGITAKLDYLKDLGVDVVWVSPIYDSPQADMGYDISDYKSIYPPYGTLEDVDRLIAELNKRGMELVMDLVVNHTSNQHAWFIESCSSLASPKRDWYIWKKPKGFDSNGKPIPPNNWKQILGEANSAWVWDETTQEFYLALFTPEQPDLNWESTEVRKAVHDILRFWLDRGVAGFRMDVINLISKDQAFPDGDVVAAGQLLQSGHQHFANGPRLHEFLLEIKREVLDTYLAKGRRIFTVGEMPFVHDSDEIVKIVHSENGFLNMIFHFEHVEIDSCSSSPDNPDINQDVPGSAKFSIPEAKWTVSDLRRVMTKWQRVMMDGGGWNSLYVENHDQPRSVSRFTDDSDEYREYGAKLLCLMQTTLCGTLFVYQGEELGMRNVPLGWKPEEYKDVESVNFWKKLNELHGHNPTRLSQALRAMQAKARDNSRTPMQWTPSSPNAGFCPPDVKPWMRVNDDYPQVNATVQTTSSSSSEGSESESVYRFWQRLLKLRKEKDAREAIIYGGFELMDEENPSVLSYARGGGGGGGGGRNNKWVAVLNFTGEEAVWTVPPGEGPAEKVQWVVGNYYPAKKPEAVRINDKGQIKLRPWEGLVGRLG